MKMIKASRLILLHLLLGVLLCFGGNAFGRTLSVLVISATDEQQILQEAGITRIGSHYKVAGCDDHLNVELLPTDLNADGQPEVILRVTGSPCFSGMMQSNVSIYVRSSQGKWQDTLGFVPAFGVQVQEAKIKGFSDVILPVLGGCDPLYRWAGSSYFYAAQVPAYDGAKCNQR